MAITTTHVIAGNVSLALQLTSWKRKGNAGSIFRVLRCSIHPINLILSSYQQIIVSTREMRQVANSPGTSTHRMNPTCAAAAAAAGADAAATAALYYCCCCYYHYSSSSCCYYYHYCHHYYLLPRLLLLLMLLMLLMLLLSLLPLLLLLPLPSAPAQALCQRSSPLLLLLPLSPGAAPSSSSSCCANCSCSSCSCCGAHYSSCDNNHDDDVDVDENNAASIVPRTGYCLFPGTFNIKFNDMQCQPLPGASLSSHFKRKVAEPSHTKHSRLHWKYFAILQDHHTF